MLMYLSLSVCLSSAIPPARDTGDAAGPAAGAALALEVGPATANPGPGPTRGPSLALLGPRRPRPSPSLGPDLGLGPGPDPGPDPGPSPGQDPEAAPQPPKEGPDQDLKVSPSLQQKMEANPSRHPHDHT